MTDKEALNIFGEILMRISRDYTIDSCDRTVAERMKTNEAKIISECINASGNPCRDIVNNLIPEIVDTTLFYMMQTLEEQNEKIALIVRDKERNIDVAEVSDSLTGELATENGWIALYSKERSTGRDLRHSIPSHDSPFSKPGKHGILNARTYPGVHMTDKEALNIFGEILMKNCRDRAIQYWDLAVAGKMNSDYAKVISERIEASGDSCRDIVNERIPKIVDDTIFYLLVALGDESERIALIVRDEERNIDVAEVSDGLMGELFGEDGWDVLYSKERSDEKRPKVKRFLP